MHSWVWGSQVWGHKAVRRHRGSRGGEAAPRVTGGAAAPRVTRRPRSGTEGHEAAQRHRGSQGGAAAATEGHKAAQRHRGSQRRRRAAPRSILLGCQEDPCVWLEADICSIRLVIGKRQHHATGAFAVIYGIIPW